MYSPWNAYSHCTTAITTAANLPTPATAADGTSASNATAVAATRAASTPGTTATASIATPTAGQKCKACP